MSAILKKSNRASSAPSPSAISSRGSAGGPTRSSSPGGIPTGLFGQALVPASRSRARDPEKASLIRVTSGRISAASYASGALQLYLENRLRAKLAADGSPEYGLTWKHWPMPSGPLICALRASARRTSDKGSSGWPTAGCQNAKGGPKRIADYGNFFTLQSAAQMAGWATSRAPQKGHATGNPIRALNSKSRIEDQVYLSGWATAAHRDYRCPNRKPFNERGGGKKGEQLANMVVHVIGGWPTSQACQAPNCGTNRGGGKHRARSTPQNVEMLLMDGYPTPRALSFRESHQPGTNSQIEKTFGFFAATKKRGAYRLNPLFSLWLMGFPVSAWGSCGVRAMQSCRNARRNSLKHSTASRQKAKGRRQERQRNRTGS